jgi:glycosyltransferase involved in cell wall biosynthesis
MNVLIAITSLKYGGPQKVMVNLANELMAQGHNCYLYIPKYNFSVSNKNYLSQVGCPVISAEKNTLVSFAISLLSLFIKKGLLENINLYINVFCLKRILQKKEINLIISNRFEADLIVYNALENNSRHNIHWTIVEHGDYSRKILKENNDRNLKFLNFYEKCNRLIVLSENAINSIANKFHLIDHSKIEKIYNGMAPKFKSIGILPKKFKIALAARPQIDKGWEEAIHAVLELNNAFDNAFELHLLGSGEYIDQLKIKYPSGSICFKGFVSDVQQYLFDFIDIGILPTTDDILPTSIIEYLSVGIPVVTYDVGEIKNMLTYKETTAGEVISINNLTQRERTEQLKKSLKKYILSPENYLQDSQIALKAFEKFDIEKVSKKYLAFSTFN